MSQPVSNVDFQQHVIDSLARLETNMTSLIGNGKDGRIDKIEDKIFWLIMIVAGLIVAVGGPAALAALK